MKEYNPENPSLTLLGSVASSTGYAKYGINDNTGLGPNGEDVFISYSITIDNIQDQYLGDQSVRTTLGNTGVYNGIDIKVGDYVASTDGLKILKIISISAKNSISISCIVEDTGLIIARYRSDKDNSLSVGSSVVIFEVNDEGQMVLGIDRITLFDNAQYLAQVDNYFRIYKPFYRFPLYPESTENLQIGDFVTITGSGIPYTLVTASQDDTVIGTVADLYGGNNVNIRPFNKIITNFDNPQLVIGGEIGSTWYLSGNNTYTTSSEEGGIAKFFQITDSRIGSTTGSINNPSFNETQYNLEINGYEVIAQNVGGSTLTLSQIVSSINNSAHITFTSASIDEKGGGGPSFSTLDDAGTGGENGSLSDPSSLGIYLDLNTGGPGTYPDSTAKISITSSFNSTTTEFEVHFTTSNTTIYNYPIADEEQIASDIEATAQSNGINITTTFSENSITIIGVEGSTLTINNVSPDVFGIQILGGGSSTGLPTGEFTSPSVENYLALYREDGGDVILSGTWLNSSEALGLYSFSGTPPYLLMLEGTSTLEADDDWYIGDTFLTASKEIRITGSLLVTHTASNLDFFVISSGSYDAFKVNSEGITQFYAHSNEYTPTAELGGIYFTSASAYIGLE